MKWKPKKGEYYYYVNAFATVTKTFNIFSTSDKLILKSNNCFETKKEASEMAKKFRQLLKQEYKQTLEKSK